MKLRFKYTKLLVFILIQAQILTGCTSLFTGSLDIDPYKSIDYSYADEHGGVTGEYAGNDINGIMNSTRGSFNAKINFGDSDATGSAKYLSDYPDAFYIARDLSNRSEDMQYFQMIEALDDCKFVYFYQTYQYADSKKREDAVITHSISGDYVMYPTTIVENEYKISDNLVTVLAIYDYTKRGENGYVEIARWNDTRNHSKQLSDAEKASKSAYAQITYRKIGGIHFDYSATGTAINMQDVNPDNYVLCTNGSIYVFDRDTILNNYRNKYFSGGVSARKQAPVMGSDNKDSNNMGLIKSVDVEGEFRRIMYQRGYTIKDNLVEVDFYSVSCYEDPYSNEETVLADISVTCGTQGASAEDEQQIQNAGSGNLGSFEDTDKNYSYENSSNSKYLKGIYDFSYIYSFDCDGTNVALCTAVYDKCLGCDYYYGGWYYSDIFVDWAVTNLKLFLNYNNSGWQYNGNSLVLYLKEVNNDNGEIDFLSDVKELGIKWEKDIKSAYDSYVSGLPENETPVSYADYKKLKLCNIQFLDNCIKQLENVERKYTDYSFAVTDENTWIQENPNVARKYLPSDRLRTYPGYKYEMQVKGDLRIGRTYGYSKSDLATRIIDYGNGVSLNNKLYIGLYNYSCQTSNFIDANSNNGYHYLYAYDDFLLGWSDDCVVPVAANVFSNSSSLAAFGDDYRFLSALGAVQLWRNYIEYQQYIQGKNVLVNSQFGNPLSAGLYLMGKNLYMVVNYSEKTVLYKVVSAYDWEKDSSYWQVENSKYVIDARTRIELDYEDFNMSKLVYSSDSYSLDSALEDNLSAESKAIYDQVKADIEGAGLSINDSAGITMLSDTSAEYTLIFGDSDITIVDNTGVMATEKLSYDSCAEVITGAKNISNITSNATIINLWNKSISNKSANGQVISTTSLKEEIRKGLHYKYIIEFAENNGTVKMSVYDRTASGRNLVTEVDYSANGMAAKKPVGMDVSYWQSICDYATELIVKKTETTKSYEPSDASLYYTINNFQCVKNIDIAGKGAKDYWVIHTAANGMGFRDASYTGQLSAAQKAEALVIPTFQRTHNVYDTMEFLNFEDKKLLERSTLEYAENVVLTKTPCYGVYKNVLPESSDITHTVKNAVPYSMFKYAYMGFERDDVTYTEGEMYRAKMIPFAIVNKTNGKYYKDFVPVGDENMVYLLQTRNVNKNGQGIISNLDGEGGTGEGGNGDEGGGETDYGGGDSGGGDEGGGDHGYQGGDWGYDPYDDDWGNGGGNGGDYNWGYWNGDWGGDYGGGGGDYNWGYDYGGGNPDYGGGNGGDYNWGYWNGGGDDNYGGGSGDYGWGYDNGYGDGYGNGSVSGNDGWGYGNGSDSDNNDGNYKDGYSGDRDNDKNKGRSLRDNSGKKTVSDNSGRRRKSVSMNSLLNNGLNGKRGLPEWLKGLLTFLLILLLLLLAYIIYRKKNGLPIIPEGIKRFFAGIFGRHKKDDEEEEREDEQEDEQ